MKKQKLKFPDFNKMSLEQEAHWWDTHDLGDYLDQMKDVDIVFELQKPKEETLILRLQKNVKDRLNLIAKSRGINVSTLARMWLMERLQAKSHK